MAKHQNKKPQPKAKRDDFSSSVKKTMAERVAYLCSNPACRILTVGPHSKSDKVNRLGEAAHITAAIEGGERYDRSLTPEQRKAIDNGIWLCCDCHKLVDSDPDAYPVELLRQWKADAEDAASNRLGKPVSSGKNLRQFPLIAPAIALPEFVPRSRDTELNALQNSLEKENAVFLWGFGGMGKSETAIMLSLRMKPAGGVFMMHYQNSMRDTILKLTFDGYKLYATPSTNTPETFAEADYRQRMKMLKEGYQDAILIVDNFDVEGKTLDELQSEPAYQELLASGIKLIFTTRNPVSRADWEIKPLSHDYQLQLMRNFAPGIRASDKELEDLIDAVDGHTLTLALMAKTLKASLRITPKQMLDALNNNRLEELHARAVTSNKDRDMTQRKIEAHLTTLFDLSKLDDHAKTVLACATLLPDGGMEPALFLDCLPPQQQDAVELLADINWLTLKEGLLTIHPVMRQVCRISLKPNDVVCGAFLDELWNQYNEYAYDAKKYQEMAACFAVASSALGSRKIQYPEQAGILFNQVGQNDTSLTLLEAAINLLNQFDPDNEEVRANLFHTIGCTYAELGDLNNALKYELSALDIRVRILSPTHPDLATTYNYVGIRYGDLLNYEKALEFESIALSIRQKIFTTPHPDLARSCTSVAYTHTQLGNYTAALNLLNVAEGIFKETLPSTHPDWATFLSHLAGAYNGLGDYKTAQKFELAALSIRKQVLPQDHPDIARSYEAVGANYSHLHRYQKALEFNIKALDIRMRILPPDHHALIASYRNNGISQMNLNHPKESLTMLHKAKDGRERTLPVGHPDLTEIYNDLALAYSFLGQNKEAKKYIRLAKENKSKEQK